MKVKIANPSVATVLEIEDESGDTINVVMFDYAPSKGKIIIEDYCQSWSAYWGGMRGMTVSEYIPDSRPNIIAQKLLPPSVDSQAIDVDELSSMLIKEAKINCATNTSRLESLIFDLEDADIPNMSEDEAKEWVEGNHNMLFNILGDDYYSKIPQKDSLALTNLENLVKKVQKALNIFNKNQKQL